MYQGSTERFVPLKDKFRSQGGTEGYNCLGADKKLYFGGTHIF